jgi:O-glycosyl hydrolase
MDPGTINSTTFSVAPHGTGAIVAGPVTYDAATNTATLTPSAPLVNNVTYLGTITTGAKDAAGNALAANVPFAFTVQPPAQQILVLTVDPAQRFQTIEGWGISMRLFADPHIIGLPQNDPNNALKIPPSAQSEILDSLYRGIGLTRVRVGNEPAGIEATNDNSDPFTTDLSKFDFSGRNSDDFLPVVADLRTRGMTHWWMSPIEIESFMNESNPDEYVEWAMAINRHWRAAGLELSYFSLANEPTLRGLPLRSGAYLLSLVKKLGQKLRAEGFATKIVIPDDVHPSTSASYAQTILADADARQYVGAIAYHLYDEPDKLLFHYRRAERAVRNSTVDERVLRAGLDGMGDHRPHASVELQHNRRRLPRWIPWRRIRRRWSRGLRHSGTTYNGYRLQSQYYSYGNFTRYVRPGAVRVAASSPDSEIQVSAFLLGGRLTVIGINHHSVDVTVRINLGAGAGSSAFSAARTSGSEHLVPLAPVTVSSGSIVVVLKATSVTTLYQ